MRKTERNINFGISIRYSRVAAAGILRGCRQRYHAGRQRSGVNPDCALQLGEVAIERILEERWEDALRLLPENTIQDSVLIESNAAFSCRTVVGFGVQFTMHKLIFFVPAEQAQSVKQAVFDAGAGRFRNYDSCSWQTEGTGQFRPLVGADPFIGSIGSVETVPELRVETICEDRCMRAAVEALLAAHPYEEPAYELIRILTIDDLPAGAPLQRAKPS